MEQELPKSVSTLSLIYCSASVVLPFGCLHMRSDKPSLWTSCSRLRWAHYQEHRKWLIALPSFMFPVSGRELWNTPYISLIRHSPFSLHHDSSLVLVFPTFTHGISSRETTFPRKYHGKLTSMALTPPADPGTQHWSSISRRKLRFE